MSKDVLITGGAGFIGSNLTKSLIGKGYDVTIVDNLSSGYLKNLDEFKDEIEFIEGDIRDKGLIQELVKGKFAVFHLAAMVSVPESVENPVECFEVNVVGSLNIIEECVENNCKFIFASSAAVYGEDRTPVKDESLEVVPISPYGLSKLDVERLCSIYNKEQGLKYACFRNFNVYGPKQDANSAYAAVVPIFVNKALLRNDLVIYGDGDQTRDFVYVSDVVDAYMLCLDSDFNDVLNLGCNDVMNVKDLSVEIVYKVRSSSNVVYMDERSGDIKHSRASSCKFVGKNGWKSKISFDDGLGKTIEYYKKLKGFG